MIWLLAQTRIGSFAGPSRFRFDRRDSGRDNNQRFVLELVRLPWRLHRQLYSDRDCGFRPYWSCCRAGAAKTWSGNLTLQSFSTRSAPNVAHC